MFNLYVALVIIGERTKPGLISSSSNVADEAPHFLLHPLAG